MKPLLIVLLLATAALPSSAQHPPAQAAAGDAFVHTVFFWLHHPEREADRRSLHEGLEKLSRIDLIERAYVGVPAPTDRSVIDRSYDFSITFIFDGPADQEAYQSHPDHLRFIEDYGHLWQRVLVYDAVPPAR